MQPQVRVQSSKVSILLAMVWEHSGSLALAHYVTA